MRFTRRAPARPDPELAGRSSCTADRADECVHARRVRDEMAERARQQQRRQRVQHQQEMAEVLVDLLAVLDTVDAAARHRVAEADRLRRQLHDVLSGHGIERVGADHQLFDPTVHQAVHHEPGSGPPMVVDLLRPGYVWNGRVLRPALVSVRG